MRIARLQELLDRLVAVPQDSTSASEKHELVDLVLQLWRKMERAEELLARCDIEDPEHVIIDHTEDLPVYYRLLCEKVAAIDEVVQSMSDPID